MQHCVHRWPFRVTVVSLSCEHFSCPGTLVAYTVPSWLLTSSKGFLFFFYQLLICGLFPMGNYGLGSQISTWVSQEPFGHK